MQIIPRDAQRDAPLEGSGSRGSFMAFVFAMMKRHFHEITSQHNVIGEVAGGRQRSLAKVIVTLPINLPDQIEGQAYVGVALMGKGKPVSGASIEAADVPSLKGSAYEKMFAANYFVIVAKDMIHVYLENHRILDFLRA